MLSGCLYQSVDAYDINMARWYCQDKGGVRSISSAFYGTVEATCFKRTKAPIGTNATTKSIDSIARLYANENLTTQHKTTQHNTEGNTP